MATVEAVGVSAMGDDHVACVVVTYLRPEPLRKALRAIVAQSRPPDAVYVIDNAHGSDTSPMVRSEYPEVAYLELPENLGVGAGLARGIRGALDDGADYVWLLDDDSIPEPRALERCLTLFKAGPRMGLVGYAGGGLRWGMPIPFRGPRQRVHDLDVFSADFLELDGALITADAVRGVGLPRSDFFMMMEGIEYSNRVARAGFEVVCLCEDLIDRTHLGAGSSTSPPWRGYYQTRNHLVMALEHRSARDLIGWGYRQLKFIAATLLHLDRKLERIGMRALGAWHGLRGPMGRTVEP